jgi:hypothetical protein
MDLQELGDKLTPEFEKELISSRVLLDRLVVIDEASRKSAAYQDPRYAPFYFHLGKFVQPKTLIEFGFGLGLLSSCFFAKCETVESFLAYEPNTDDFYSPRLAFSNVKKSYQGKFDFYRGKFTDDKFLHKLDENEWDLAFLNDETSLDQNRDYLDLLWERMSFDGFIVMNYLFRHKPAKDAFETFCKIVNRKPVFFNTRYGTGIVQK